MDWAIIQVCGPLPDSLSVRFALLPTKGHGYNNRYKLSISFHCSVAILAIYQPNLANWELIWREFAEKLFHLTASENYYIFTLIMKY